MKKRWVITTSLFLFLSATGYVASQRGPAPRNPAGGGAALAKEIFTVEGQVTAVDLGLAQGQPAIQVDGQTIVLGPYHQLQAAGFAVAVGDQVRAEVFRSIIDESRLVAVSIDNLTTGQSLQLRDEYGRPLTRSARGGGAFGARGGQGAGPCGGTPQVELAREISGTVASVTAEPGRRGPEVVLADGTVLAAGPYRLWAEAGFTLQPGDTVSVTAFPCSTQDGRWVIMSIEKSTGEKLILRDDDGRPLVGQGVRRGSRR
ncbi:MAG: hypothetical protein Kow00109_07450 [Acidobacteriota bacterium]